MTDRSARLQLHTSHYESYHIISLDSLGKEQLCMSHDEFVLVGEGIMPRDLGHPSALGDLPQFKLRFFRSSS